MSDELYHYGVKGMKWGIRRTPAQLGHKPTTPRKKKSSDDSIIKKAGSKIGTAIKNRRAASKQKKAVTKAKKKSISEMSDDELRQQIARLELEKRYRDLQPQKVSKGKSFVSGMLENSARNIGQQTTTYLMGKAVNAALHDVFNEDVVNPKKGQKDK